MAGAPQHLFPVNVVGSYGPDRTAEDRACGERVDALERLIWTRQRAMCDRASTRWLVIAENLAIANASFEQVLAAVRKADGWIERAKAATAKLDRLAGVTS